MSIFDNMAQNKSPELSLSTEAYSLGSFLFKQS